MNAATPFEPLPAAEGGPSHVIRAGRTVRRPSRPWTGTVHALLRHLEDVGYAGSPRVVGSGVDAEGYEVLTYVEGTVAHHQPWSDEGIWQVGRLLRDLHAATASFRPPQDAQWQPWWMHSTAPGAVVGHADAGPWHLVRREGSPVALLDWTLAGPVDPLDEVVSAGWWNAQLHDDDIAERHGLPDAASRARQLRLFLDGYGVPAAAREGFVTRMIEIAVRDCADEAVRARITPDTGDPTALWSLAWRARSAGWTVRHRRLLERAVQE